MSTFSRLTEVFNSSKQISISNSSKLILMSDVHRSDNSWSDNFAHNQNTYVTALNHYYKNNFTYVELGDGDELWENRQFLNIRNSHSNVFNILHEFYTQNRLYFIYGNHDIVKKNHKYVKNNLYYYYNDRSEKYEPLFKDIECYEGLIFKYKDNKMFFMVHGHQGDLFNDKLWWVNRFLVRYIWRPLELYLGFKDPTSTAKNYKKKKENEEKIAYWAKSNNQMIITGHTHRPRVPSIKEPLFYNTGSCVHPRCITAIEIENGTITLVKWSIKSNSKGILYVAREIIVDPQKLKFE